MRTRKQIQIDIQKFTEARERLQGDLSDLQRKEAGALALAGAALLDNKPESSNDLPALRSKIDATNKALELANSQLRSLTNELSDFDQAESMKGWIDFEHDLPDRLTKIRALLGTNGLKGELDAIKQELDAHGNKAGSASQDSAIMAHKMTVAWTEGTRHLYRFMRLLDAVDRPNYTPQRDSDGAVIGFGRLPEGGV